MPGRGTAHHPALPRIADQDEIAVVAQRLRARPGRMDGGRRGRRRSGRGRGARTGRQRGGQEQDYSGSVNGIQAGSPCFLRQAISACVDATASA